MFYSVSGFRFTLWTILDRSEKINTHGKLLRIVPLPVIFFSPMTFIMTFIRTHRDSWQSMTSFLTLTVFQVDVWQWFFALVSACIETS